MQWKCSKSVPSGTGSCLFFLARGFFFLVWEFFLLVFFRGTHRIRRRWCRWCFFLLVPCLSWFWLILARFFLLLNWLWLSGSSLLWLLLSFLFLMKDRFSEAKAKVSFLPSKWNWMRPDATYIQALAVLRKGWPRMRGVSLSFLMSNITKSVGT